MLRILGLAILLGTCAGCVVSLPPNYYGRGPTVVRPAQIQP